MPAIRYPLSYRPKLDVTDADIEYIVLLCCQFECSPYAAISAFFDMKRVTPESWRTDIADSQQIYVRAIRMYWDMVDIKTQSGP